MEGSFVLVSQSSSGWRQTLREYAASLDFKVLASVSENYEFFAYKSCHWRLQHSEKIHAFQKDSKRKHFLYSLEGKCDKKKTKQPISYVHLGGIIA